MDPKAVGLLTKERVCVLAVSLADGSPHAAEMHYSEQIAPVKLFIQTYHTVKVRALEERGGAGKAAVVLNLAESEMKSLQMRGEVRIVTAEDELQRIYSVHYKKHPTAEKYKDSETVFLEFTPTWWRYSDFTTDPETVIESA